MTNRQTITIAVVAACAVLIAAGVAYFRGSWQCADGAWAKIGHPLSRAPQAACPKPEAMKICSPPWSCGRLARADEGEKAGSWFLKYEDVTGPAQLEVSFLPGARCSQDGVTIECARMWPPSDSSVDLEAAVEGGVLRVATLDIKTNYPK